MTRDPLGLSPAKTVKLNKASRYGRGNYGTNENERLPCVSAVTLGHKLSRDFLRSSPNTPVTPWGSSRPKTSLTPIVTTG